MKYLQELKTWLEAQRLKAHKRRTISRKDNDAERLAYFAGKEAAFSLVLDEAELLLSEQPGAITDDAHLRKHDVRRSAACEESTDNGNVHAQRPSETSVVRQNEQTKEPLFVSCEICDVAWDMNNSLLCPRCFPKAMDASGG